MATRAIIRLAKREEGVTFSEHPDAIHTQIYHHHDGYPEYLGVRLSKYLRDFKVVNGIGRKDEEQKLANGLGCLSAQIVSKFKNGPGGVYVDQHGTKRGDLDYIYYVWATEGKDIWISIFDAWDNQCLFVGGPQKLINKYKDNTDD